MAANERKILTTLTIGGEKEFKAALDDAYSGLRVLSSGLKANSAELDKNGESVDGLTKRGELLAKEIDEQKKIVAVLADAVDKATEAYTENSTITDEWKIKLNNAKAALSNMERNLQENNKALDDAKSLTKKLSDGLKDFGEAAEKTGKKIEDAGKKVSALTAAAAAMAAAAVKVTTDSGKWADELSTLSAKTGVSTETLQKWTYAAKFIDTEVDTMTGSMAKMIRQMDAARKGTGDSADAFRELGIKIKDDATGELRDSEAVFMDAIDALGKVKSETDRDALAMKLFGKSAQDLNPLIKAGSTRLKELGDEAEKTGVVIGEDGVKSLGEFDDTMEKMNSQIEASKNKLAIQLAPTIEMIVGKVTDVIAKFGEWVKTLDSGTVETILQVAAVAAAIGPLLIIIGKLSSGIGAISSALSFLIANPAALAITAVVALTAALVAWGISMQDSDSIASQLSNKAQKRTQEVSDQKDAYNRLKNAQAAQAEADLAQIQNTQNLWGELQNLADESGRVTDANKTRAEYILGELNSAYGTEYTLVDGMIVKYKDMQTEIDNLIEKRKFEVVQKAALPLFEKAITDEINLRMDAERDLATLEEAKAAREGEYTELVKKYGQTRADSIIAEQENYGSWAIGISNALFAAGNEYRALDETVSQAADNYAASTEAVKNNLADQTSYQSAELLAQKGNYEEAYSVLSWYSNGLQQKYDELKGDEKAQRLFLQNEYDLADSALRTYLNNVLSGVEEYNESTVRSLTANATDLYNKAKEGGVNVGEGLIAGMDDKKPGVTTSISDISDAIVTKLKTKMGIQSPSTVMKGIGKNVIQGLEDGMNDKKDSASTTASDIGSLLVRTFKNIFGIKSPSAVFRDQIGKNMMLGLAEGITGNVGMVNDALSDVIPDTKNVSLDMGVVRNFYDVSSSASGARVASTPAGASTKTVTIAPTYIYNANDTSYAEQERIRERQNRTLVRELSAVGV